MKTAKNLNSDRAVSIRPQLVNGIADAGDVFILAENSAYRALLSIRGLAITVPVGAPIKM